MLQGEAAALETRGPADMPESHVGWPLHLFFEQPGVTPSWAHAYGELRQFAMANGHCHVPYRQQVEGRNLYAWAAKQRARRDRLTQTQSDLLEGLPGWAWDFREAAWEASFSAVMRFVEREGHCRAPRSHTEDGLAIGRWLSAQRQRLHTMDSARRARLQALPGWADDARTGQWWDARAAVARFAQTYGHARVPYGYASDGRRLGMWVARQRRTYRLGRLSQARAEALEALPGWGWSVKGSEPCVPESIADGASS